MLGDGRKQPVMAVWGPTGIGKSQLLAKMVHECANLQLRRARILFRDEYLPDYLAILRACREDIGVTPFNPFTEKIRDYFADPRVTNVFNLNNSPITVGSDTTVEEGGELGEMVGVKIVVDPMTSEPRADLSVSEDERRIRLTETFLDCLATTAATGRIVIFVDAVEKMPINTARWLWNDVIDGVSTRGADVCFVISGQLKPNPEPPRAARLVRWAELRPLAEADVGTYLTKRGCPADKLADYIKSAVAASKMLGGEGHVLYIAMFADNMEGRW
jgi:hypothetical protein